MSWLKKGLVLIGSLSVLAVVSIYIFIPGELTVSKIQLVKCNISGAFRSISEEASWKKWWPAEGIDSYSFGVSGNVYPDVKVALREGGAEGSREEGPGSAGAGDPGRSKNEIGGIISLLSVGLSDSTAILWTCHLSAGWNPMSRVLQYRRAIRIRNTMGKALPLLGAFLEKKENIYGMDVRSVKLLDSTLIVTQIVTASYPTIAEIYGYIHSIRDYVAREGAKETDYPMLHVLRRRDGMYESMIGIPVDRELKGTKTFVPIRFVPWKVLTGEVHGGVYTAERAMDQLALYATDYSKTSMADSFQSLVTERDKEADTSRWITRVVQPVP